MDPVTHIVLTRALIGRERTTLLAGVLADAPFYLTYPPWLARHGLLVEAFRSNTWPPAPRWMMTAHIIAHSLPLVAGVALVFRCVSGRWPRWALAWGLHILVDLPTHSRQSWAPQPFWPFSSWSMDGISWPELLLARLKE